MVIFYITLLLTFILSLASRIFSYRNKYTEITFVIIVMIIFTLVAGLRTTIGDTPIYIEQYRDLASFNGIIEGKDKGYTMLILILYQISTNPQFMLFVTSFITQVLALLGLYRYKNFFELQTYMYITSGFYLVTMNGIRQSIASVILFISTNLIIKGDLKKYILVVLLASTIHESALIMIPLYFIVRQPVWSRKTSIIIFISSICFVFFYEFVPIIFDLLGDSTYSVYEEDILNGQGGATLIRWIVNLVPVLLAYMSRDTLKEKWPESNAFVNISLINVIIMAFSLYNWIFARFSIYFQLYNFVLLPFIVANCFKDKKETRLVYYLFVVCYFIFFLREQVIGGLGLEYRSTFYK